MSQSVQRFAIYSTSETEVRERRDQIDRPVWEQKKPGVRGGGVGRRAPVQVMEWSCLKQSPGLMLGSYRGKRNRQKHSESELRLLRTGVGPYHILRTIV